MATAVADNIWELAISQQKQKLRSGTVSKSTGSERNLLLVGSKGVGKTTLIHRFVERTEAPKPTLVLLLATSNLRKRFSRSGKLGRK